MMKVLAVVLCLCVVAQAVPVHLRDARAAYHATLADAIPYSMLEEHVTSNADAPLSTDNIDFSTISNVKRLGGAAEGAYLITSSAGGSVVVKLVTSAADGAAVAYNLAKDFKVTVPKTTYLKLDGKRGKQIATALAGPNKAKDGWKELAKDMTTKKPKAFIVMATVDGTPIAAFKNKPATDAAVATFIGKEANMKMLGRLIVFDMTILNADRFKLIFMSAMNAGNLMISSAGDAVAIDQDFAQIDPGEPPAATLEDYGAMFAGKADELLKDPAALATKLTGKLATEGFAFLQGKEAQIAKGITEGIATACKLAGATDTRVAAIVASATKKFPNQQDLDAAAVKAHIGAFCVKK